MANQKVVTGVGQCDQKYDNMLFIRKQGLDL